jgi:hypothetical protein
LDDILNNGLLGVYGLIYSMSLILASHSRIFEHRLATISFIVIYILFNWYI